MQESRTVEMVLAFAVLAICIFAYGEGSSPAWWWVILIGSALAIVVFARAWADRSLALSELSMRTTKFVATELVLPALVAVAAAVATIAGGEVWRDAAIILAVALALVSLL